MWMILGRLCENTKNISGMAIKQNVRRIVCRTRFRKLHFVSFQGEGSVWNLLSKTMIYSAPPQ